MRKPTLWVAVLGLILAACATAMPAASPPANYSGPVAERPQYTPGERWSFTNPKIGGWDYVYTGQRGGLHVFQNVYRGKTFDWLHTPDLALVRSEGRARAHPDVTDREASPNTGVPHFPLFVGKRWQDRHTYTAGNDVAQRSIDASVAAYEQITVPAGTFSAFKIEVKNQRLGREAAAYETYWYAPDAKFFVKYFSREFEWEMELVRYQPTK